MIKGLIGSIIGGKERAQASQASIEYEVEGFVKRLVASSCPVSIERDMGKNSAEVTAYFGKNRREKHYRISRRAYGLYEIEVFE